MINVIKLTVNPFQENTFLLVNDKKEGLIIDPGFYTEEEKRSFLSLVEREQIKMKECWLTHAHLDHIFGCKFIYDTFDLSPKMHVTARVVYESAEQVAQGYGVAMEKLPAADYCWKEDGQIEGIGQQFKLMHTPGHSPGSVSFYSELERSVWAGDALFEGSIGRTDLPGGSFNLLEKSIREKLYTLPNSTKVYCGHGAETSIGVERKNNPYVKA